MGTENTLIVTILGYILGVAGATWLLLEGEGKIPWWKLFLIMLLIWNSSRLLT